MRLFFVFFGAAALAFSSRAEAAETPASVSNRPPNIVLILADDLGYRELGCYGQKLIRTPNLDQLAAEGMRLTQHYCGNAVCAPSRCVLMTGLHPGHATVRNNRESKPEGQTPLLDSDVTLAEVLKSCGYATGAFGKWGLGGPGSSGDPLNQGFDRFFGYNCQRHAHSYYPDYLWSNSERVSLENHPAIPGHGKLAPGADPTNPASYNAFKGKDYAPDRIRDEALSFIREHREVPFFLYYPSTIPHVALHVPDEDLKPYLSLGWQDPPFTAAAGGYTPHYTPRAAYAAMISRLDTDVGALMRELQMRGLEENTLVIFSSDNGTTHLELEVDAEFFSSVGELRGLKGSLYEGGIRVPTIVRWPGRVPSGVATFVSGFEDWMPTILDAIGQKDRAPKLSDGISLLPTLTGNVPLHRDFLYREFSGYGGQQCVRSGQWKAIRQNLNMGDLRIQLYDLTADPGEQNDVAGSHPELVDKFAAIMAEQHRPSGLFPLKSIDPPAAR